MNELQALLGDSYKDGMSIEEINTALKGKKFADLSTGAYVDKNKYDADIKAKDETIKQKAQELASKMTADEKAQADVAAKDALIEELKEQIKNNTISSNRNNANAILAANKKLLAIADNDKAYDAFISGISSENSEATTTLATYINKLITDSYEKGKKDASRDRLGDLAKGVKTSSSADDGKGSDSLGKLLAKESMAKQVDPDLYFKPKNN